MKQFSTVHIGRKRKKRTQTLGLTQWVEFLLHKFWIRGKPRRNMALVGRHPHCGWIHLPGGFFSNRKQNASHSIGALQDQLTVSPGTQQRFKVLISSDLVTQWWGMRRTQSELRLQEDSRQCRLWQQWWWQWWWCDQNGSDYYACGALYPPHQKHAFFSLCTSSRHICSSVQATVFEDQKPSIVYLPGNNVLGKAMCEQANLFYRHKTNTPKFALDLRTLDSWDMMPNETCSQERHFKMERRNQAYL